MRRLCTRPLLLTLALVAVVAVASIVYAATATSRAVTIDNREVGEVLVDGRVVIRIRQAAGGYSPAKRAESVADRLNDAIEANTSPDRVRIRYAAGQPVVVAGNQDIITVTRAEAQAAGTSSQEGLARAWADNVRQALGGTPAESTAASSTSSTSANYAEWEGQANKVVPILSAGTPGISIGAARVTGPQEKVDQTKAVAQIEAEFRGVARIRAFIPVSDLNITRPRRVQGVSVNALIDMRVVGF